MDVFHRFQKIKFKPELGFQAPSVLLARYFNKITLKALNNEVGGKTKILQPSFQVGFFLIVTPETRSHFFPGTCSLFLSLAIEIVRRSQDLTFQVTNPLTFFLIDRR